MDARRLRVGGFWWTAPGLRGLLARLGRPPTPVRPLDQVVDDGPDDLRESAELYRDAEPVRGHAFLRLLGIENHSLAEREHLESEAAGIEERAYLLNLLLVHGLQEQLSGQPPGHLHTSWSQSYGCRAR